MSELPASPARAAVFAPIGDAGRARLVEDRIAAAIRSGLLGDGERLPTEAELAGLLGVALVTVREALDGLRGRSLITTVRGRNGGSFVTTPASTHPGDGRLSAMSRLELRDRAAHYLVVLTGSAELAAERVDPGELDYLRGILATARDAGLADAAAWQRAETELHLAVAALTQSARITRDVIRQEADFGSLLRLVLSDDEHRRGTSVRLDQLLTAIEDGDGAAARSLVRAQVREEIELLADLHAAVR